MLDNVGLYSYLTSALAYAALTVYLGISWRGRALSTPLLLASAASCLWGATIAAGTLMDYPPIKLIQLMELARNAAWLYFLVQLAVLRFDQGRAPYAARWNRWLAVAVAVALVLIYLSPAILGYLRLPPAFHSDLVFITWVALPVAGLLLIEQLFRNAGEGDRWGLKYLCFGLGGIFAFDFFMNAEGLLFRNLDPQLWQARGVINAIATPLIAISVSRNSASQFNLQVSRQLVFHSVTLLGAGLYLIMMAMVGYFIKYLDATWGGVLQVTFLMATGALLLALLFSGKIRASTRVFLSKHFFSYKYDYREEWLKFTNTLAGIGDNVPLGIIQAMGPLVNSPAGMLWAHSEEDRPRLLANWQMAPPPSGVGLGTLPAWMARTGWVIDLEEWRRDPDLYADLEVPDWLGSAEEVWLIVPLMFSQRLQGMLLLKRSEHKSSLNWEDRDLLKTAGRQAATHLAQFMANKDLVEARQFEAFNRLSAYVVHDLKNILAQQSLMVTNAERHKDNPAFIDDMIATVSNSVERMTRLMAQMREGVRGSESLSVDLGETLQSAVAARAGQSPAPRLVATDPATVEADRERLETVFGHLIQNAQDATGKQGRVDVRIFTRDGQAVVEIQDNGIGMDGEFLRNRLFKPFDSTKGLTGMGIGAFESREFIRGLGGDILVESEPGEGSTFRVCIPCAGDSEIQQETG